MAGRPNMSHTAIQALVPELGRDHAEVVKLTGIYHNLIRTWADL